jgi:hypothetical protein
MWIPGPWMGGHFGGNKAQRSEPCRRGATQTRPNGSRCKQRSYRVHSPTICTIMVRRFSGAHYNGALSVRA